MYLEKYQLGGRVAVVTGGGRGIGLASAQALAEAGAHVVVADIDAAVAGEGLRHLQGLGYSVEAVTLDVTDSAAVTRAADALVERLGHVDILVNNAGIARIGFGGEEMSDDDWHQVLDVNLNGVFYCSRAFGAHMLKAGSGAVVNIGSMSGVIVNKPQKQAHYNASKAAVHHLTKSLAAEWAERKVRVNAVAPTYVETPILSYGLGKEPAMGRTWLEGTPMRRFGQPDEIASVVLFLASDASSLLTGSIVLADAGFTLW